MSGLMVNKRLAVSELFALALWLGASLAPALAAENGPCFYLVGVGPGDPDLITVRAVRVLEKVDVVFCPRSLRKNVAPYLEDKNVLDVDWFLWRYYGQDPSELGANQRRLCEEIARKRRVFVSQVRCAVRAGKTVAVLSPGDPLIYGPHAWCLEEFEDLEPVVIPGLSCFNAANAALGRDVTKSRYTRSVILAADDWPGMIDTIEKLSAHRTTMVLFTMKADFDELVRKLSVNYPAPTPVAIVKYAGYAEKEEVVRGTLATIREQVDSERLPFEYLIYVGDFLTYRYKKDNANQR